MNSNTSSTGGERQDRPGFGWAGRSAALSLWIISVLLWCVLMRQSFTAMPWDDMTVAGERLQELRRPFAAAGMAVGGLGSSLCLGCLFWLCLSSLTSSGWGIALRRVLAAGCWGFLPGVLVLAGTVGCLTTVIFPEAARYWGVADVASPGVQPSAFWIWLTSHGGTRHGCTCAWGVLRCFPGAWPRYGKRWLRKKMSGSLPSAGALPSSAWL